MSWTPSWEQILNAQFGEKFIAGNNEFEIIGYYRESPGDDRAKVRVLCESTQVLTLVNNDDLPVFPQKELCILGTFQVESFLQRRLA